MKTKEKNKTMLNGTIENIDHIGAEEAEEMYALMSLYYDNITWEKFSRDLYEKQWVIILRDARHTLKGFSTMMITELVAPGSHCNVLYSGDTIIDKKYWGQTELQRVWCRLVFFDLPKLYPGRTFYWILITKGYKTYRLLSTNFKRFYPSHRSPTPKFEKEIMDRFCQLKYPGRYDSESGIIYNDGTSDMVKKGVADITEKHLNDSDIAFFCKKNPGYYKGDELVCITEAGWDNLQPHLQQLITTG